MGALIPFLLGGVGLFLIGMQLLTEGAKALAGDSLRIALLRFTGTPWKAFLSGSVATLLVQSSSVTTVTVIGFVSAGLISFPQALGVVFGASLGTTATGWLVAVFGLKISLGVYALPFVGIGAFVRLMGRGRWRALGLGVAGFGLIFLGIDFLQQGMDGLRRDALHVALPSGGLAGHLAAMTLGIAITLVLQSSSAAIAVTMTALHSGALTFEQAAPLVVGASIGTTSSALLASIGATNPARRTAVAFVLFNLASGLLAILLMPVLLRVVGWESASLGLNGGATSLAAFHTTFVGLGVLLFLPFVDRYARLIEKWIPDRRPALTRYLDKSLLQTPAVALEAVRRAVRDTSLEALRKISQELESPSSGPVSEADTAALDQAVGEIQAFLASIPRDSLPAPRHIDLLHAIDHLVRLRSRVSPASAVRTTLREPEISDSLALAKSLLQKTTDILSESSPASRLADVQDEANRLAEARRNGRVAVLEKTIRDSPEHTLRLLDAMRWLDRVGYHAWRLCVHLPADPRNTEPAKHLPHPDD
jgi:phosphate:Na+ symporter